MTSGRMIDDEVVLGPNREAADQHKRDPGERSAIVLASGGLGLISLTESEERMSLERDRRACTLG